MTCQGWIAVLSLAVAGLTQAEASSYTYTLIADNTGSFSALDSAPTLNNAGTVAFWGSYAAGGEGIFTSGGGAVTTIAAGDGVTTSFAAMPSINDAGTVAFITKGDFGYIRGIFTGDGGSTSAVYTNYAFGGYSGFSLPVINNSGTVALSAIPYKQGTYHLLVGNGGPLTDLATGPGGQFFGFSINDFGLVAVNIVGTSVTVSDGTTSSNFGSVLYNRPAINNSGTVAFGAYDGSLVFGSGGPLTLVADTTGAYAAFGFGYYAVAVSINDAGIVAFRAELDAGGAGIFTGPDAVADKVIAVGDTLFGSTVTNLVFASGEQLNDAGSVAFVAYLADGRQVIVRADVIPEPSTFALVGLALCVFLAGAGVVTWIQPVGARRAFRANGRRPCGDAS